MKLSIFTPTHDPRWLCDAYQSIAQQPFDEWLILYNNGAQPVGFADKRVKEVVLRGAPPFVGALKREAVERASGFLLLELDHDDLLLPGAVQAVRDAFEQRPESGFVYSNTILVNMDWSKRDRYPDTCGWCYRPVTYGDWPLDETVAFDPTPAAVSRIWYAPDHLRAFRRDVYDRAGGYRADMRVLDDQDLMARMYTQAPFHHIDEPLYLYRVHGQNAWLQHNQEIQNNVMRLYDENIQALAQVWAKRLGLRCLDLGGELDRTPGYECVDIHPGADVVWDLNARWPFEDGSVGVVRAWDVFEHLTDIEHTMNELYRVLAPGGYAFLQVPSTDGRGAFQDPTHRSYWNQNTFSYFCGSRVKWGRRDIMFQTMRLYTTDLTEDRVCWVRADLLKLTPGLRVPGPIG